jgi:hypothetical protein
MASWRGVDGTVQYFGQILLAGGRSIDGSLTLTSGKRSPFEQMRLYDAYLARGKTGIPVAYPGTSLHEMGLAFDLARPRIDPFQDPLLAYLGQIWRSWGGGWSPSDPVHFQ